MDGLQRWCDDRMIILMVDPSRRQVSLEWLDQDGLHRTTCSFPVQEWVDPALVTNFTIEAAIRARLP